MSFGYDSPTSGPSGDGDRDDAEAAKFVPPPSSAWTPPGWRLSPLEMEEKARAENIAVHAHVAAAAGKHSNPSQVASQRSF